MKLRSVTIRERATGRVIDRREFAVDRVAIIVRSPMGEARAGFGDQIEKIAKPIARAIDRVFGTKFATCGGCAKRRAWLNALSRKK